MQKQLRVVISLVFAIVVAPVMADQGTGTARDSRPALYVAPPGDGFEVYLAAAIHKKGVPVRLVEKEENATLILKAAAVEEKRVSTGAKVVNCLFLYAAGMKTRAILPCNL